MRPCEQKGTVKFFRHFLAMVPTTTILQRTHCSSLVMNSRIPHLVCVMVNNAVLVFGYSTAIFYINCTHIPA